MRPRGPAASAESQGRGITCDSAAGGSESGRRGGVDTRQVCAASCVAYQCCVALDPMTQVIARALTVAATRLRPVPTHAATGTATRSARPLSRKLEGRSRWLKREFVRGVWARARDALSNQVPQTTPRSSRRSSLLASLLATVGWWAAPGWSRFSRPRFSRLAVSGQRWDAGALSFCVSMERYKGRDGTRDGTAVWWGGGQV